MQYICLSWEFLQLLILYSHCCHRVWGICNIIIALFLFKEHISGTDKELAKMLRPRPAAQTAAGLENVKGFLPNYNGWFTNQPMLAWRSSPRGDLLSATEIQPSAHPSALWHRSRWVEVCDLLRQFCAWLPWPILVWRLLLLVGLYPDLHTGLAYSWLEN